MKFYALCALLLSLFSFINGSMRRKLTNKQFDEEYVIHFINKKYKETFKDTARISTLKYQGIFNHQKSGILENQLFAYLSSSLPACLDEKDKKKLLMKAHEQKETIEEFLTSIKNHMDTVTFETCEFDAFSMPHSKIKVKEIKEVVKKEIKKESSCEENAQKLKDELDTCKDSLSESQNTKMNMQKVIDDFDKQFREIGTQTENFETGTSEGEEVKKLKEKLENYISLNEKLTKEVEELRKNAHLSREELTKCDEEKERLQDELQIAYKDSEPKEKTGLSLRNDFIAKLHIYEFENSAKKDKIIKQKAYDIIELTYVGKSKCGLMVTLVKGQKIQDLPSWLIPEEKSNTFCISRVKKGGSQDRKALHSGHYLEAIVEPKKFDGELEIIIEGKDERTKSVETLIMKKWGQSEGEIKKMGTVRKSPS